MARDTTTQGAQPSKKHPDSVRCPNCGKKIVAVSLRKSQGDDTELVLNTRVVFFTVDNAIKGQCGGCKKMVDIPYKLVKTDAL